MIHHVRHLAFVGALTGIVSLGTITVLTPNGSAQSKQIVVTIAGPPCTDTVVADGYQTITSQTDCGDNGNDQPHTDNPPSSPSYAAVDAIHKKPVLQYIAPANQVSDISTGHKGSPDTLLNTSSQLSTITADEPTVVNATKNALAIAAVTTFAAIVAAILIL